MSKHKRRKKVKYYKQYPDPFKSLFEYNISLNLTKRGIDWEYEGKKYEWFMNTRKGTCSECGSNKVRESHIYTPDWYLPEYDLTVESKGIFSGRDRKIQQSMKEEYPDLGIKMLFYQDNRLSKLSKTKYSEWCLKQDIDYHVSKEGVIPERWLK